MCGFHSLKVKEVKKLTPETVSISLEISDDLKDNYAFNPGQFVIVEKEIGGEKLKRYYSIYSTPGEEDIKLGIKLKGKDGFADYAMHHLKTGEHLDVSEPMDDVKITLKPEHEKKYLAVTIGSGITPFYSIIREMIKKEPKSHFVLVYGNHDQERAIFLKQLRELQKKYPEQFKMYEIYSQEEFEGHKGRINEAVIQKVLNEEGKDFDAVYIIGPDDLKKTVADTLTKAGIPGEKFFFRIYS